MNLNQLEKSIGLIFHPRFPPETLAAYARRAEAAGFDELWLWDDCFLPGAFTSAALALQATDRLRVGIGLLPVPAYNPLFAAMEITNLARTFPGRFMPGFGHGVGPWMQQIGAPGPSIKSLEETVTAVRRLLSGEMVTMQGEHVKLDRVQMQLSPDVLPPIYMGAMREKTLRLAGRLGDGTLLTGMSSPDYARWAVTHIRKGMAEAGRSQQRVAVYLDVKVNPDGERARAATRRALAERWPWSDVQLRVTGIAEEAAAFVQQRGVEKLAAEMPDAWLDAFAAAGTPKQVAENIERWFAAGVDTVIFQPLNGDSGCLEEYEQYLIDLLHR